MFLLVPAYPGSPGQKAVKRLCVCVVCVCACACVCVCVITTGWLGSRVLSVLVSGADGPGFKS